MMKTTQLFFATLLISSGCASFSTLQEPSTVRKGQFKAGIGASYSQYEVEFDDGSTESAGVPQLAAWARYGVTDDLEVHTNAWFPLGATVGAKYQLAGDRDKAGFVASPGLDVGYIKISGDDDASVQLYDMYVPLHLGYRASKSFVVYGTPKYLLRYVSGNSDSAVSHAVGGTLGIGVGSDGMLLLEGTMMRDLTDGINAFTASIGYQF